MAHTTLPKKDGGGSNFHETLVALVAPGEDIKSALYNGKYGQLTGTSQATALVTGAAAILMAVEPLWRIWQIKARLVASADLWAGLAPHRKIFAGNLNIQRAVLDKPQSDFPSAPVIGRISLQTCDHPHA